MTNSKNKCINNKIKIELVKCLICRYSGFIARQIVKQDHVCHRSGKGREQENSLS